ncbi:hypothetical protein ACRALDRAFT_2020368 [Sodiomyces alcalophilus JCM 7366]|uniref:uncharacterized protein n=1 Tax=Sodiomyces alcalophilus JCM 7366 TaxID=591952 RepID=UPI0039B3988D
MERHVDLTCATSSPDAAPSIFLGSPHSTPSRVSRYGPFRPYKLNAASKPTVFFSYTFTFLLAVQQNGISHMPLSSPPTLTWTGSLLRRHANPTPTHRFTADAKSIIEWGEGHEQPC